MLKRLKNIVKAALGAPLAEELMHPDSGQAQTLDDADPMTTEWTVFRTASTARALFRAARRGLGVNTVVDVGASNGSWTEVCMKHLPRAQYLLIEAQDCHVQALEAFQAAHPNVRYVLAAAGDACGECYFDDTDAFSGVASAVPFSKAQKKLPMVSVDSAVEKAGLAGPYLLKLDTHGFEPSILRGAAKVLENAELVIIEAYIFQLEASEAITFDKLCLLMDEKGFRLVDFSEPMWREKDMALWQWDLFFIRKDSPVFASNSYA